MPECSVSEVCLTFSSPQTDPGFLTFLTPWTDPGIKPMCLTPPALAGGFFTTEPPGKPSFFLYIWYLNMPLGRSHFSSKVYIIASSFPH